MMAGEYDLMLPEDRDRKLQDFERERREWVETLSRGKARFILLHGLLRFALFLIAWDVFYVIYSHVPVALAVRLTALTLLCNPVFNLLEWYWKDRRYGRKSHRA